MAGWVMPHNKSQKKREDSFKKPGLGQFKPGDLSRKDSRGDGRSVAPPVDSRFVRLPGGKTGTKVDVAQPPPRVVIEQSAAFAEKFAQAQKQGLSLESPAPVSTFESPQTNTLPAQDLGSTPLPGQVSNQSGVGVETQEGGVSNVLAPIPGKVPELPNFVDLGKVLAAGVGAYLAVSQLRSLAGSLLTVGTSGLVRQAASSTAGKIAVNSATQKATASWLSKLASASTNPGFVVSGVLSAIGSYPFAGFVKEEALQTTGFAADAAFKNGDVAGMQAAVDLQDEVLNPNVWRQIVDAVPFANVQASLKDYYKAAQLQSSVQKFMLSKLQEQQAGGLSDAQMRVKEKADENAMFEESRQRQRELDAAYFSLEQEARRRLNEEFNRERVETEERVGEIRLRVSAAQQEARRRALEEEAAFWLEQRKLRAQLEEEERLAIEKFWLEYRKKLAQLQDDNRPSRLGFGLLK